MNRILITGRNSLIPMAAFSGISDAGSGSTPAPELPAKSNPSSKSWHDWRLSRGEVVRGGWFVFRRGETTGRLKINPAKLPFEHSTREAAMREAWRLASKTPGVKFSVFSEVAIVSIGAAGTEAPAIAVADDSERVDAYKSGSEARAANTLRRVPPEIDNHGAAFSEAWLSGWDACDAEMQSAKK